MNMRQRTFASLFHAMPLSMAIIFLNLSLFVPPVFSASTSQTEGDLLQQQTTLEQELSTLQEKLRRVQAELEALDTPTDASSTTEATKTALKQKEVTVLDEISVVSTRLLQAPRGTTRTTVKRNQIDNQPAKDFRESLESQPGIILRKRNGPRDYSIAIRGFGAKQAFGVQKIRIYEDGFDLTQSDGLSRLDLQDPWFMEAIDVERGASSAIHGNYALGGTVNFRTRRGRDINGVETFTSVGSYGYQKYGTAIGKEYKHMDAAVFVSHERGDGYQDHGDFTTTTVDANFRFRIDDQQTFFFKAANNDLNVLTPNRLTLGQFQANPKQAGPGTKANDRSRRDHRTIIGGRYTNQITPDTEVSLTGLYDNKDINQKFGITLDQEQPNWKTRADIRNVHNLFGMPLRSHAGIFFDYLEMETTNFRNLADGRGSKQNAINNQRGSIRSIGFRIREELDLTPQWTIAAGLGYERTHLSIDQVNFGFFSGTVTSNLNADRKFHNLAPDVSIEFHPNEHDRYWTRVSGGYGTPNFGNLTTTPTGLPGANNDLDDERSINLELGGQVRLHPRFNFQLIGFWNFFKDELINQAVGGGTGNFSTNADSSEYRGIELAAEWVPLDGLTLSGAYTYINAKFINYTDSILVGGVGTAVNRDGNKVPAVEPHVLNFRTAYDHRSGFGGWAEVSWIDDYFVNNANTLKAQSATVVNVNLHYAEDVEWGWVRLFKAYVQVDNLFDQTYMGSGAIVSDSTADASKQAFLLAPPLSVFGGITLGLF